MPIYEYRCLECQQTFEREATMSEREASRPSCPQCGSERVEQVLSSFFARTARKS